jgi:cell division protein FtsB
MSDYSELKQLALASLECQVPTHQLAHDYAFEQAAKPGLIWQLIEKYEGLNAETEKFADGMRSLACVLGAGGYNAVTLTADQLVAKVNAGLEMFTTSTGGLLDTVTAERDQLKTENEALRGLYQMRKETETREMRDLKAERDQVKAQNEALRDGLAQIIEMNRQHAEDQYGDADKAEGWSCIIVARAALAKALKPCA